MPWKTLTPMEETIRFVLLAQTDRFTLTDLCQQFGISRSHNLRGHVLTFDKNDHPMRSSAGSTKRNLQKLDEPESSRDRTALRPGKR